MTCTGPSAGSGSPTWTRLRTDGLRRDGRRRDGAVGRGRPVVSAAGLEHDGAGIGDPAGGRLARCATVGHPGFGRGRRTGPRRFGADRRRPGVNESVNPMSVRLRRTPPAFRWWLAGCVAVLVASYAALYLWAPGPDLAEILREPGALILLALVVLADLYPSLPWMRESYLFDEFILSTPLSIAALMVFGPHAAAVFIVAGAR